MNFLEKLPDQIFEDILLRVPYTSQSKIKQLLKPAREMMEHIRFNQDRIKSGLTKKYICLLLCEEPAQFRLCLYDPVDQSCKRLVSVPRFSYSLEILTVKQKIILKGMGFSGFPSIFIYDLLADTWKNGAEIPIRGRFGWCVSPDGLIYIASHEAGKTAVYNVEEDEWELLPRVPKDVSPFWCVFIEGMFYVIDCLLGRCQGRFDPNTRTWTAIRNMPSPYCSKNVINAFGQLIGFGYIVIEQYDWEQHRWTQFGNIGFDTIVCATVWCDRIFLCGYYERQQKFAMYIPGPASHERLISISVDEELHVASMATIEV